MEIKRAEFLNAIKSLQPGIDYKNEVSDKIYFDSPVIFTTTKEVYVSIKFKTDMKCCIYAEKLYAVVQKIDADVIDISCTDTEMIIKAKRSKFAFTLVENDFDSYRIDVELSKFKDLPDDLLDNIKLSMFSLSNDPTLFPLNCVCFKSGKIYTCDNLRASRIESNFDGEFLMPQSIAVEIVKYGFNKIRIDEDRVQFYDSTSRVLFVFNTVNGNYPDIDNLFSSSANKTKIKFPEGFVSVIDRVSTMSSDDHTTIRIRIAKTKLTCHTSSEHGWADEVCQDIKCDANLQFSINAKFFSDILKHGQNFTYNKQTVIFGDGRFNHIIALISDSKEDGNE